MLPQKYALFQGDEKVGEEKGNEKGGKGERVQRNWCVIIRIIN